MNTANYTATDSYPLTTEGLDFIQKQILILEQTAAAYGNGNWILQGMTDNSGILSSGVVAIVANGTAEIVEYDGGDPTSALNGKWKIVTTVNSSPARTVKKLTYDNTNGTITGLSKPYDVSTLRAKFDIINHDIQNLNSSTVKVYTVSLSHDPGDDKLLKVVNHIIEAHGNFMVNGHVRTFDAIMFDEGNIKFRVDSNFISRDDVHFMIDGTITYMYPERIDFDS